MPAFGAVLHSLHGREDVMYHPRDMGATAMGAFLTMLATASQASASIHNQVLSAQERRQLAIKK